jgi:hypothetical protein
MLYVMSHNVFVRATLSRVQAWGRFLLHPDDASGTQVLPIE